MMTSACIIKWPSPLFPTLLGTPVLYTCSRRPRFDRDKRDGKRMFLVYKLFEVFLNVFFNAIHVSHLENKHMIGLAVN